MSVCYYRDPLTPVQAKASTVVKLINALHRVVVRSLVPGAAPLTDIIAKSQVSVLATSVTVHSLSFAPTWT